MTNRFTRRWILLGLWLSWIPADAASAPVVGEEQQLLCALVELLQCEPARGCTPVSAESIDAARFMEVDLAARRITALLPGQEGGRITEVERIEQVQGLLVLQGAEDDRRPETSGLGYTLAIDRQTGHMSLAVAGNRLSFVVFGSCIPASR